MFCPWHGTTLKHGDTKERNRFLCDFGCEWLLVPDQINKNLGLLNLEECESNVTERRLENNKEDDDA